MNLTTRIRYAMVDIANHSQRVCWAECVAWAEGMNDDGLLALFGSAQHNDCNDPAEPCYCGKFCPPGMEYDEDEDVPF